MRISGHLPASWEACIQVKKQQLELDMEQRIGSKCGKEYVKAVFSPCILNLHAECIMQNAGLDEAQLESTLLGEISVTSDMQMTPTLGQNVKNN